MTDQIERVAFAMWKAEAMRAAPNVGKNRTIQQFSNETPEYRDKWRSLAEAAVAAVSPAQIRADALREAAALCKTEGDKCGKHYGDGYPQHELWDASKAILALLDQPAIAPAGKVKPLVWEDMGENFAKAAAPLFGNIRCERYGEGGFTISWSVPGFAGQFTLGSFPTLEAAKAAAQADYEARILAALDVMPIDPAQIRADGLREAYDSLFKHPPRYEKLGGQTFRYVKLEDAAEGVRALLDQPAPDPVANAALSAALRVLADTSKAEIDRLTEHLKRIAETHPDTVVKGARAYAKDVLHGAIAEGQP